MCKLLNSLIFIKRHLSTLSFFVIVLLLVCVRFIWSSYFVSYYLNQDTEDLTASTKEHIPAFIPLHYNQLWTSLPNTSQYFFGLD